MKEIITLTDKEARIDAINVDAVGVTTVTLEWGGPEDREVYDFDVSLLGDIFTSDTEGHGRGWVVLEGECLLKVGDTLPFVSEDEETATVNSPVTLRSILTTPVSQHLETEVSGTHRVVGTAKRRNLGDLLGEAMEASGRYGENDQDVSEEMSVRELLDWHCDYNWDLA